MAKQETSVDINTFNTQMNYEQAQAMKLANLMALLSSIKEFNGDVRALEGFIQRMDQVQGLVECAKLEETSAMGLQGLMMSKIELGLLIELGLSFTSSWAEAKHRLKERYRSATKTAGRVAWRMVRTSLESGESLIGFCRRLTDMLRQTKDRVTESCNDSNVTTVKLTVYEELAMETLINELPERLKTTVRAGKPNNLEELIQLVREEELEREERNILKFRNEKRTYSEITKGNIPRMRESRDNRWKDEYKPKFRDTFRKENKFDTRVKRGPKFQCWECGGDGHLARNCRYRQSRRQRADEYHQMKRGNAAEPMEINAISQELGSRTGQNQTRTNRGHRRDSMSTHSDSQSSDGERGEDIRSKVSNDNDSEDESPWRVVHHGRPWQQKRSFKTE